MKLLKNGLLTVLFAIMIIIPLAGAQNSATGLNLTNYSTIDSDTKIVTNFVASDVATKDELSFTTSLESSHIPHTAAYFHPSTHYWYLDYTNDGIAEKQFPFGSTGDIPVVGDWDGNGITDVGVFHPSTHYWYLDYTNDGVAEEIFHFGSTGDIPVIGDWNGDGKDDVGIFRPSSGLWNLDSNGNKAWEASDKSLSWGLPNDLPVLGDWNGDGKTKIGIFRPSNGMWSLDSNGNYMWEVSDKSFQFGSNGDTPKVGKWALRNGMDKRIEHKYGTIL